MLLNPKETAYQKANKIIKNFIKENSNKLKNLQHFFKKYQLIY